MAKFRFFDPWAVLDSAVPAATAAKLAKPAKPDKGRPTTLATLATLAGSPAHPAYSRALTKPPTPQPTDGVLGTWGEVEEECAAIVEYDGGIRREWAEGVARLDPDRPPADVPPNRWRRFIDDIGFFLDSPFYGVAAALGWTAFDLFGANRERPLARIDQLGLLWLLNGDRLDMLTDDAATILRRSGARQTWRRTPTGPCQVLAWEFES